jgi:Na+/H+-dicarboxylate symporter
MNGKVPVAGMVLVLGIDRFMSEARAITNLFGNTVATIFVAWWEGSLDLKHVRAVLDRPAGVEAAVLEPRRKAA